MKKSKAITLVLITGTVLLGCERDARNRYASWGDCVKDYTDPTKCVEEKDERNPTTHYYYGPWYRGSYSSNPTYNPSVTSTWPRGWCAAASASTAEASAGEGTRAMIRRRVTNIRENWKEKLEGVGFHFYEMEGLPYWDESAYYEFTLGQVEKLEAVTNELYEMCIELVEHVIKEDLFAALAIPESFHDYVRRSWDADEPSIYGRFDFWYDGKSEPKLLEFNADTPTALFEASVVQYYWLQDFDSRKDQFNSLHEGLLEVMKERIKDFVGPQVLYFACAKDSLEDYTTVEYLRDVAIQAGMQTAHIFIDDVGYDHDSGRFVDLGRDGINRMFKLYPWEWLIREPFAEQLLTSGIRLLEPAWKMVLSNKAILPLLWEMYPAHKNLLPAYFRPPGDGRQYVQKPFFSREGEGIYISDRFGRTPSEVIFQGYRELPSYDGNYPVVGSWIIGGEARGMGIREDTTTITNNLSRFVPHLFE